MYIKIDREELEECQKAVPSILEEGEYYYWSYPMILFYNEGYLANSRKKIKQFLISEEAAGTDLTKCDIPIKEWTTT